MLLEAEVALQWQGHKLEFRGIMVQFPAGARDVSLLQTFQTDTGTHPASGSMRSGDSVHGVKQPKRKSDHSLPSSVKVQKDGSCRDNKMGHVETILDVAQKYNVSFTY